MERHRLEGIRRSLAMAPTLPADSAKELMDSIHALLDDWEAVLALADELQRISAELRELHPDARARQRRSRVSSTETPRDSRSGHQ